MKTNKSESEINKIRVALYEETKDLSIAEHTRKTNERAQKLGEQYGFVITKTLNRR